MNENINITIRFAIFVLTKYTMYEPLIHNIEFFIENFFGYEVLFCFVVLKYSAIIFAQITFGIANHYKISNHQSTESEPSDSF